MAASTLAAIDARIAEWSARWFVRAVRRQASGGTPIAVAVGPMPRHRWRGLAPGVWLDWGECTSQKLALQALGRAEPRPKLSTEDENLLAMLGERVARDLAKTLVKSSTRPLADPEGAPGRAVCFKLCVPPDSSDVTVAVDTAVLVGLRKQQCPPWQARDAQPLPLGVALGSVPVAFDVALGRVSIGVLEFEAIEPGDTIVLDQPVAAPLALRSAATGAAIRDTRLVREDGQLTLTAS